MIMQMHGNPRTKERLSKFCKIKPDFSAVKNYFKVLKGISVFFKKSKDTKIDSKQGYFCVVLEILPKMNDSLYQEYLIHSLKMKIAIVFLGLQSFQDDWHYIFLRLIFYEHEHASLL